LGAKVDNCLRIQKELYYGGDFDQICAILKENPKTKNKIRFFIGYSGWDKEQLDSELEENSWITVNNVNHELILDTNLDDLWKTTLEMQQGKFKMISKFPNNPNDN
jgi:putative transcriptional regulator